MKELISGGSERKGMIPTGRNERKKILGRKNYDQVQQVLVNVGICVRDLGTSYLHFTVIVYIF